jgi:hypothetical protein
MFETLIAWLTKSSIPVDTELADLAGVNGYPAEIRALKKRAAEKEKSKLRIVRPTDL